MIRKMKNQCFKIYTGNQRYAEKISYSKHDSSNQKEDIEELAAYADKEANPLYPVPKLMDAKQLEKFYIQVMEENK